MKSIALRSASVVFAVLLVTSSIAVATAGGEWSTNATGARPLVGTQAPSSVSDATTASKATASQEPLRTVFADGFGDNDISDWNTSGRPESPGYTVEGQTATTEVSVRSSGTKGNGNGKGNGKTQNGSSGEDLSTESTDTGDVIADSGQMRLRVHQCYFVQSRQHLGTFEGNLTVSFDWETAADSWYEHPDWRLVNVTSGESIPYEVVSGTDVSSPGYSTNKQGSMTVRAEVDGPVAVEFYVSPSGHCGNSDHANTYLWVDNVAVDYRPVPVTETAIADTFSDNDTAEWNESGRVESAGYSVEGTAATQDADGSLSASSTGDTSTKESGKNHGGDGQTDNGTSASGDLSTQATGSGDVILDNSQMRLHVYRCYLVTAQRPVGIFDGENLTVSFDWKTAADNWYEEPGWRLVNLSSGDTIPYEVVSGTDVQYPGQGGNRQGSVTVRANVSGPVAIEYYVQPSSHCAASDHANTYLWVDNVTATYELPIDSDDDGLPDDYEQAVVETGSYGSDSDAAATATDEANDDVIDSLEDFDGDGVAVYYEYRAGTDQFAGDTDSDNLTDDFELRFGPHPLDANADGDNVTDDQDDADADGLTNVREQDLGTHPLVADTDSEGLNDSREIDLGTDPLVADTDSDGLPDDEELALSTDPLANDTDADGVVDGNETYTTSAENASVGVAVDVSGDGNVAAGLSIENDSRVLFRTNAIENATATELVELASEREFENATITFAVNASTVNTSDLRVFTYNESAGTFEPLNSTVGGDGGAGTQALDTASSGVTTISANTTHFSTFGVFNESAWAARFEDPLPPEWGYNESFENLSDWQCSGDCDTSGDGVVIRPDGASGTSSSSVEAYTTTTSAPTSAPTPSDEPTFTTEACLRSTLTRTAVEPQCGGGGGGGTSTPTDTPAPTPTDTQTPPECFGVVGATATEDGASTQCSTTTASPTPTPTQTPYPTETPCAYSVLTATAEPSATRTVDSSSHTCADFGTDTPTATTTAGSTTAPPPIDEVLDGTVTQQRTFAAGVEQITLVAEFSATVSGSGSETRFEVVGEDGSTNVLFRLAGVDGQTDTVNEKITADLSAYAGQTVTFRYVVVNDSDSIAEMRPMSFKIRKDTDGDGLSDSVESEDIRTGEGDRINIDPYDADTDDDGLPDGIELGERKINTDGAYYDLVSHPKKVHSDADDFDDFTEVNLRTDPRNPDTDGDGEIDSDDADPLHIPSEDKVTAGDHVRAFIAGVALGEMGMPGGFAETNQAKSAFYMLGWLVGSVLPTSDARDLIQNVASGDAIDAVFDAMGLVPLVGDVGKSADKVKTFVKEFPSQRADSVKVLTRHVLKKAPDSATKPFLKAAGYGDSYARLVDSGLEPADVEKLIGKLRGSGKSLDNVKLAAKVGDDVAYLTREQWNHIKNRHIYGTERPGELTDFFPTGVTVPTTINRPGRQLPDRMTEKEVEELIIEAIKHGTHEKLDDLAAITFNPKTQGYDYGIDQMKVVISQDGKIITAHPESGADVWRWWGHKWERNPDPIS